MYLCYNLLHEIDTKMQQLCVYHFICFKLLNEQGFDFCTCILVQQIRCEVIMSISDCLKVNKSGYIACAHPVEQLNPLRSVRFNGFYKIAPNNAPQA